MKGIRRFKWSLLLLVIFFILWLHSLLQAEERGLLWQISSNKSEVYLLGSIHIFKKEFYPLNQRIEKAFSEAEVVVFEVNLNEMGSMQVLNLFQQKGLYPEGDSLKSHVSEKTLNMVLPKLEVLGITHELAMRLKPWMLAVTIQSMELQNFGFFPEYGIDHYLYKKAEGKEIKGLETPQYQIEMFDSFSERLQELFLLYTIKDLDRLPSITDLLVMAWKKGDTFIIQELTYKALTEEPELLPIYEKLFFERNTKMASKIEEYLTTGKKHFVIIGAGHLVGEKGIIEILKKKGYKILQL
ncbi:MAG: TraB/GumN family protein [Thermodesulfovibrionales bacterium]|nr:TraB/GumN family protein [Thermodesulfovibrionales bacterium]